MMIIKTLSATLLVLAGATALAAPAPAALSAATESEFLASAGTAWKAVGPSRYETVDAAGKRTTVAFGEAALADDIASLKALGASLEAKLLHATAAGEQARLRNSISETRNAVAALEEGKTSRAKLSTSGSGSLNGCGYSIAVQALFELYPAMISSGGVTVEAYGPSFIYGGGPAIGTVTLTAIANGLVDTDTKVMYPDYMGDYLSSSAEFFDWGCNLEGRAAIVPACPTSGYRSVKWTTTCTDIGNGTNPNPVYSNWK